MFSVFSFDPPSQSPAVFIYVISNIRKKARLKDGEIAQRRVKEEVRQVCDREEECERERTEYESESSRNLWRARSLKIIERHKSPSVGTSSSSSEIPRFLHHAARKYNARDY